MKRIQSTVFCLSAILFAASLLLNIVHYSCRRTYVPVTDTTTVTIYDTVSYHNPVPQSEKPAGIISGRLPLASPHDNRPAENIPIFEDLESIGKEKPSPPPPDSADVEIPITQKCYKSTDYTAYVSGYNPCLDSIYVFPKSSIIRERSYQLQPSDKWHIGITGGFGYGFKEKQAEIYIGIGITYSLFSF